MQDRELYQTILGLTPPWSVDGVELRDAEQAIEVVVSAPPETAWRCPECDAPAAGYDHVERRWRHLDTCQYQTFLHARVPPRKLLDRVQGKRLQRDPRHRRGRQIA